MMLGFRVKIQWDPLPLHQYMPFLYQGPSFFCARTDHQLK
jgi:hypothetical protein